MKNTVIVYNDMGSLEIALEYACKNNLQIVEIKSLIDAQYICNLIFVSTTISIHNCVFELILDSNLRNKFLSLCKLSNFVFLNYNFGRIILPNQLTAMDINSCRELEIFSKLNFITKNEFYTCDVDNIIVYTDSCTLLKDGVNVNVTITETKIIIFLLKNKGRFVTRDEIIDEVYEGDKFITKRVVDVHLCHIKKKLGTKQIITQFGKGYQWVKPIKKM